MSILFNLTSIGCGLIAVLLPVLSDAKKNRFPLFSLISLAMCSISLLSQIFEYDFRVNIQDFSALTDTSFAVRGCAVILIAAVFVLNATAYLFCKQNQREK